MSDEFKKFLREFWSLRQYHRLVEIFKYLLHPFKK